jgi:hypothetical protein
MMAGGITKSWSPRSRRIGTSLSMPRRHGLSETNGPHIITTPL